MSQPNVSNSSRKLTVPTMPQGVEIASFGTYLDAQAAVDHLSDKAFPVQFVTIVGTDLKMVERVTGRLTYGRVTLAGLAAGAWFGLFVGILLFMFGGADSSPGVFAAIALGAGFGALFSLISYAFTGGKRDFTSQSQIVAAAYTILCAAEHAGPARELLRTAGLDRGGRPGGAVPTPGAAQPVPRDHGQPGQVGSGNPYAPPAPRGPEGSDAYPASGTGQTPGGPGTPGAHGQQPEAPQGARVQQRPTDSMYVTPDGRPKYGALRDDAAGRGAPASGDATQTGGATESRGEDRGPAPTERSAQ